MLRQRSRPTTKVSSSSIPQLPIPSPPLTQRPWVVTMVKVLLLIVIWWIFLPDFVDGRKNRRRQQQRRKQAVYFRTTRYTCAVETCGHLLAEEALPCILPCLSNDCYTHIYQDHPLEPGQVDIERALEFEDCIKEEYRTSPQHYEETQTTENELEENDHDYDDDMDVEPTDEVEQLL